MEKAKQVAIDFAVTYGFQIIGALFILAGGFFLAKWAGNLLMKALLRREMEPPVRNLIVRIARLLIFALTAVIALDKFGVQVAPLVAGIGVAGVGIGFAMQGVLGNLIAGLFIIIVKPFRVGEYVELLGVHGEVKNIELFNTRLGHPDRSIVVIPNRKIVGEILHNYGVMRQIDLTVGIPYNSDVTQALAIIQSVLAANPRVIKDPSPVFGVTKLGDSSIDIRVAPWVAICDMAPARSEIYQSILQELAAAKIVIPFPQREIRILNESFQPAPIQAFSGTRSA